MVDGRIWRGVRGSGLVRMSDRAVPPVFVHQCLRASQKPVIEKHIEHSKFRAYDLQYN